MFALRKLKVGARLAAGFGLLLLLITGMLAVVIHGNSRTSAQFRQVVDVNMAKVRLLNSMLNTNNNVLMQRRLMLIKRGADFEQDYAYAQNLFVDYDKAWEEYLKLPRDANGDRMVQEILEARRLADQSTAKLDDFMKADDFDAAIDVLLNELRPLAVGWNRKIAATAEYQNELTARSREDYLAVEARTRSRTRPLADSIRVADGIAAGRLDNVIDTSGNDEPAALARSMQRMQQQVQSVIDAQRELARQHDAGTISYRIDHAAFPGEFGTMAQASNALVASHVETIQRSLDVLRQYSVGDFSTDMDRLPGEKAAMTETVDGIKGNLAAINGEIRRLANAA